ncbi:MAG: NusA-like transcription termination signal-binding factor [Candidatus Aenigmarchaeota archaeon]|jgi:N utilization substance protein A|nr:NusA-like transcription termination signal-binding factor [Candidatus Aenigmarchaeota archaeon]
MTITFTTETIRLLTLFENVTNVPVRDCFIDNGVIYYIVEEGKIGLAIGKDGSSIKKVERVIGKKVKVFEYSSDPETFVKNIIPQCREITMINQDDKITVEIKVSKNDRGFVIGRGGEKIKIYKEILKRVHNISDIQVK